MADERDDAALAAIEAQLDGYPDPRFRERLRRSLERRIGMATTIETAAVTPYVMTQDIEPAIAFAKQVFGAEEVQRSVGSAGGIHCQLRIGDSIVFFGGAVPGEPVKPRLLGLHVYVGDVDAVYRRAIDAGGTSLGEPAHRPYGERAGFVRDPAGNHWYIATRTGPTYFAREPGTVTPHLYVQRTPDRGAAEFIAFLNAAFGAEVELRHETPDGRVMHAVVRIRGTAVEIGEGGEPQFDAPSALVVSLDDLDAAYERALAAGATPRFPPAAQTFGGRMAGVADAWGNEWFLASRS
jgi:PhnB protein